MYSDTSVATNYLYVDDVDLGSTSFELRVRRPLFEIEYREGLMWKRLRWFWKWLRGDWKRWLVIPALAVGLVGLVRLVRRRGPLLPRPGPAGTLTPEEGQGAHDQVDEDLEAELVAIDQEVENVIAAGREKYGGGS